MLSQEGIRRIFELRKQGLNICKIARTLKISRPTVLKYLHIKEENIIREREPQLTKITQNRSHIEVGRHRNRGEQLIRQTQFEAQGTQRFITEREEWIKRKGEDGVDHLKYTTQYQFRNLLNVKHFLSLKEEVRKTLTPLYGKESDVTVEELIRQIAKDYHDKHIKPSADKILQEKELTRRTEERETNRQLLINRGVNSVYWKTRGDDIDLGERRELEDFVRGGLEEEISGEETDQELESLVETLIDEWFEGD
jgi:helix-turn-helix resolvase-like protein